MNDLILRLRSDTGAMGITARLDAADLIQAIEEYAATVRFPPPDLDDPTDWEDGWKAAMAAIKQIIHPGGEQE